MNGIQTMGMVLVAVVLLAALVAGTGCRRTIGEAELFFPRRIAMGEEQPGRRHVVVPTDDEAVTLRGWYLESEEANTTVIYFYGNGETVYGSRFRLEWMVETLGVNVLALDYRGYGFSEGTPTVEALAADAARGYDWLRESAPAGAVRVLVYARSIGTAVGLELADRRPLDALILEAPFPGLEELVAFWNRGLRAPVRWFVRLRADPALAGRSPQPVDLIARVRCPLLVIHGTEDTIVPTVLGHRMFEAAPGPDKTWCEVTGVGHNDLPINHPDLEPTLVRFVEDAKARPARQ